MRYLVILLLLSATVFGAWCSNSFYCDRTYDYRIGVNAPYGNQNYGVGPINLQEFVGNQTIDMNSFFAVKNNEAVPVYFTDSANPSAVQIFFKSNEGPGDYNIYFDTGSGRPKSPAFKRPPLKEIQECGYTNPDGSCNNIKKFPIDAGNSFLKFKFDIRGWSPPSDPGCVSARLYNGPKIHTLYSGTFGNRRTVQTELEIQPQFSSEFLASAHAYKHVVVITNLKIWAIDFENITNYNLENQSQFEITIPENISGSAKILVKNNGPEQINSLTVSSENVTLSENYLSFGPYENKTIIVDFPNLKGGTQNITFNLAFDSKGSQVISKKINLYTTEIKNVTSEFLYLENNTHSNTKYFLFSSLTNSSQEFESNSSFFISLQETEDSYRLLLKNPFNFSIEKFYWNFTKNEMNESGAFEEKVPALENFTVTIEKSIDITIEEEENIEEEESIEQISEQEEIQSQNVEEEIKTSQGIKISVFSPKSIENQREVLFSATVHPENSSCELLLDDVIYATTKNNSIEQLVEVTAGNHSFELKCSKDGEYKIKKIDFEASYSEVEEEPENTSISSVQTSNLSGDATLDLTEFFPAIIIVFIIASAGLIFYFIKNSESS